MIYKLSEKNQEILKTLGHIWLESNITTHNFINEQYWLDNYDDVIESFKEAEIIIYAKNTRIIGFCGLIDNYIAGMFVEKNARNQGAGTKLMQYLQKEKDNLSLKVYKKNIKAVNFYKKHNFKIKTENQDETQNKEYIMSWQN